MDKNDLKFEHTNRSAIWSTSYDVVIEFEVLVKDSSVELNFPVEGVDYLFPFRSRTRHGLGICCACITAKLLHWPAGYGC